MHPALNPMLNTAVKAARRAASLIQRGTRDLDLLTVERKPDNSLVSEIDRAAEAAIVEILLDAYPHHSVLGEEGGIQRGRPKPQGARKRGDGGRADASRSHTPEAQPPGLNNTAPEPGGKPALGPVTEFQWIIDPLDGTTNFLHGVPQYCVSIALAQHGTQVHGAPRCQIMQGVIFNPNSNELFTASRGGGAFLNDRRLRVSRTKQMEQALLCTGFPYKALDHLEDYIQQFRDLSRCSAGIRRMGSAALDLAYIAAGRFDGFWELGLSSWDIAAGSLLVQEAGGLVTDFDGESDFLTSGDIVAGTPRIFGLLLQRLQATAQPSPANAPARNKPDEASAQFSMPHPRAGGRP